MKQSVFREQCHWKTVFYKSDHERPVFGVLQPGKFQTSLLSYRDQLVS